MLPDIVYLVVFSLFCLSALHFARKGQKTPALMLGISGFVILISYYFNWVMDDAYISLRFAANLAQGYGPTFNPGQPPVEGFSNPTWTFILAIPELLGLRGLYPVKVISVIFALLNIPAIYFTAKEFYRDSKPAVIALILTAFSAPFAVWAGAGLETPRFSFLVIRSFYYYLTDRFWVSSIFLGLIALTRPEGFIFLPLYITAVVISGQIKIKYLAAVLIPGLLIIIVYLLFRTFYFDDILPNTFYAKMGGGWEQALAGISYLMRFSAFSALPLWTVLGMISLRKRITDKRKYLVVAMIGVYLAFIISAGFDLPAFRFIANVWPLVAMLCAGGFLWVSSKLGARWRWAFWLVVIGWSAFGAYQLQERDMTGAFADGVGIRESGEGERSSALAIGLYLKENAEPGEKLALIDAGLMPYYSRLETFDVWGLCNKEIAEIKYNTSRGVISRDVSDERVRDLFFGFNADYVALDVTGQTFEEAREFASSGDYASLIAHPQFRAVNEDPRYQKTYMFIDAYPAMPEYSILLFQNRTGL